MDKNHHCCQVLANLSLFLEKLLSTNKGAIYNVTNGVVRKSILIGHFDISITPKYSST